ncbi:MAG: methyltransferase domain-containing protein [Bacillota bacterium]
MNDIRIKKFENPERIAELNPRLTLHTAGFERGMTLSDIGAGTGLFSFAAAEIDAEQVYALEISEQLLELLEYRVRERNVENISVLKSAPDVLPLADKCCDFALMVTVFHELDNPALILAECKRILVSGGKLVIIEFHKRTTPMGPPVVHRIAEEAVEKVCAASGFATVNRFLLGDNFYCLIFAAAS